MRFFTLKMLAIYCTFASPAVATPLERGRAGLEELPVHIHNIGEENLSCGASLAHWYSERLGTVGAGKTLSATLFVKPETGAVFLLNASQDRMPVERLWCGLEGRSWETRREISFERRAGTTAAPVDLDCRATTTETICTNKGQ